MKDFSNMERNFNNIQFEKLRKVIDDKYNVVHDELSDCYYNKKAFRTYGVLDKTTFDKLHGLIFDMREVNFHEENLKQIDKDKIPTEKYNTITDKDGNVIGTKSEESASKIAALNSEGIHLEV